MKHYSYFYPLLSCTLYMIEFHTNEENQVHVHLNYFFVFWSHYNVHVLLLFFLFYNWTGPMCLKVILWNPGLFSQD